VTRRLPLAACLFALLVGGVTLGACAKGDARETVGMDPNPNANADAKARDAKAQDAQAPAEALATFGGGCFWCTEALFRRLDGVLQVTPGYAGGTTEAPTYQQVCSGTTGHAEVIQIRYDPSKVTYEALLEVFFATHDPTRKNRQGADVGSQYRSLILTHDASQRESAARVVKALDASGAYDAPLVTEIAPFRAFYPAEAHNRDYFGKNPQAGYCRAVIQPKVEKFEKVFRDRLKSR